MASEHVLSGVSVDAPTAQRGAGTADLPRGFYLKAFPSGGGPVTFTDADDYGPHIVGELAVDGDPEGEEEYALNGDSLVQEGDVTFSEQTVNVRLFRGDAKLALLLNHRRDRKNAANRGAQLAFLNVNGDGSYDYGRVRVNKMLATYNDRQLQTGYDTTFAFPFVVGSLPAQTVGTAPTTATTTTP